MRGVYLAGVNRVKAARGQIEKRLGLARLARFRPARLAASGPGGPPETATGPPIFPTGNTGAARRTRPLDQARAIRPGPPAAVPLDQAA